MTIEAKNYIDGQWVTSENEIIKSYNPANFDEAIGEMQSSTEKDIDLAVEAAKRVSKQWKRTGYVERGNFLYKVADEIEKNLNEIAETLTKEMGKTLTEAIGETKRGIAILRYYASEGMRKQGDVIPATDQEALMYTKREPIGVVGIITPWNFPVAIPIWKIAPALIYGNTVVFKPATESAITAFKVVECFVKAGLPKGVLNFITGAGRTVGNALISNENIDGISFTGSDSTGKLVAEAATRNSVKFQLEMGGKNPVIVMDDANLEDAVNGIMSGAFKSTGQKCTATSRVIVEEGIYEKLKDRLVNESKNIKVGNGLEESTWMGPCVSESQMNTVLDYISIGQNEGAKLLVGGERLTEGELKKGYYVSPAVFENVHSEMRIANEEIFGPVIALIKVKNITEAIEAANSTRYGLSASLYTSNIAKALEYIEDIESGMVRVNAESAGVELQAPFGGTKFSSAGSKEQGEAAKEFYTTSKTVLIRG
ncbi:alpha-ketoglutaric semialdehyde dehydrogenase GucD [Jeotgalibacillus proteolyticus]|uniref:Aldehyde dehydrogenase family protein n=1 Tax=Jeotgalibacillus proteolyticus TaxID=2082395 RepID=A0A2S5G673_9BACL|nr:alpha-ketoglutaric semialdehyde dehydrogenase GucD [Jeotgalibacillus proteolyticus]PPA68479.1 aldehyde dehydrogenase family protein [Jeotgalibacillus proteolyticus]